MKTTIKKLSIPIFLLIPIICFGQSEKISGNVVAFNKFPLKNITVTAKKAKTKAVTDEKGQFEIQIKKNDVIRISESEFIEYSKKISNSEKDLTINLILRNNDRDMTSAIEKGYISQEDLDYGKEKLWHLNNEFIQFTDTYNAIKYAVPESTIIYENGQKGIQLRGPKTLTGSNFALILVNGVIADDVSFVTPTDIISIRRLSSSEAAIYGARAGNGVIRIETR